MHRLLPCASVACLFLVLGGIAQAAPSDTVTLRLGGGNSASSNRACGERGSFTNYRTGDRVYFAGSVTPAPPAGTKIAILVRTCLDGKWEFGREQTATSRPNGSFRGSFRVDAPSKCFVRASYKKARSAEAYFHVR
jgi:hypothetical protein